MREMDLRSWFSGGKPGVTTRRLFEDLVYTGSALLSGRRVGFLKATVSDQGGMLLGDIEITDTRHRRQGIGGQLVADFLEWCRETGQPQVRGFITASDLHGRPWLPGWYEKAGFEVLPADRDCIAAATFLIVWRA